ncbi:MAG TPA: UDP-N-acetylmuramoyl-tripeptide--D-alanyl-D-alanine ligase [Chitinophagales bacterium]|nr:UDP-N-acetylmuramoyl-tripeptide--D-alanyl-D-alanine ligase [Chitinophagales bacterium]
MEIQELYQLFLESNGVTTDSRNIGNNQIFFALKGERFDGNEFALDAIEIGAKVSVVDDIDYHVEGKTILVEDTLYTLQALANYHRKQFSIPIIGITGSNGKTTTKELIHQVLKEKYNVLATIGNLNNHIGVPLTLLRMSRAHEIAIIEMGANHVQEIEILCKIAEPNYGVITSIGKAHIGEFGSFEAIKNTKAELYQWLAHHEGVTFINADMEVLKEIIDKTGAAHQVIYGTNSNLSYTYQYLGSEPFVKFSFDGNIVSTQLPGEYNFCNFITACTIGQYFEVTTSQIINALNEYQSDNNRSQIVQKDGLTLIMDAYNANPSSMESALENLKKMESPQKGAVLGHMLELGDYSLQEHQNIVQIAESLQLDFLVLVGAEFKPTVKSSKTLWFEDSTKTAQWWKQQDLNNYLVLIKGSRGIALEKVVK